MRININITKPKFIITLIILTLIATFIGVLVPQVGDKSPSYFNEWELTSPKTFYIVNLLQFNRVYTSIWFLALVSVVGISLAITVRDQLLAGIKAQKYRGQPVSPEVFKNFSTLIVPGTRELTSAAETIKSVLRTKGFKVCHDNRNSLDTLVFSKNGSGRFGGAILHAGFLCVIVAALYNLAFHQRGVVQLMEAETFSGRNIDWLKTNRGLLAEDFNTGFQVHLKRFVPSYWDNDKIKSLESELNIIDETGVKDVILNVSSPVQYKHVTLYQSFHYGYVLTFVLTRQTGQPIATHFLLDAPGRRNKPFTGKTDFPTTDYIFDMKFYPNLTEPSFYLAFPCVDLTITKKGRVLFRDRVLFNQQVIIGDEIFRFARIHYWSGISFVNSSELTLVYIGFTISIIGAFLIYFLIPKEMHIKIATEGNNMLIKIRGRARKYQPLFADEFDRICQAIQSSLKGG